jgi:Flp pilus assembly protein TadG
MGWRTPLRGQKAGVGTMIASIRRRWTKRFLSGSTTGEGQTIVEFAIVSVAFLLIVFGTIDFGRSIYLYAQLHNAVRDVAREGKVGSANGMGVNTGTLRTHVANYWNPETQTTTPRPGLENVSVSVTCFGGCTSGNKLTVTATLPFQAVTQSFLGIKPINLTASATVTLE